MTKEVNINLGDKGGSQEKGRSCFDGVCPPNPLHLLDELESGLPMILGLIITMMKMDQFNRPLANTIMQMVEGLAPQIEKNATQVGEIINSLTEASHNVKAKMDKHADDFTKEDKVQLVQMLINDQNNYFDSYDSVLDFLNYQNPGFIKALYKTLLANMNDNKDKVLHANSKEGKKNIDANMDPNRTSATKDRYTDLHDNLLDAHIAKAKQGLALSTVGLEGKGLIKSPAVADAIKQYTGIKTDKPSTELTKNTARLNRQAEKDKEIAKESLKKSVEGDEEGAEKKLVDKKMTAKDLLRLKELDAKSQLTNEEITEKEELKNRKKAAEEKYSTDDKPTYIPTNKEISTAQQQITTNSASAKATLASQQARHAEAKSEEAKAKVADANKKLADARANLTTAKSVKDTATKAVNNDKNKDPKLRKDLEAKLRTAVEAEGNADEKVKNLESTLQEAKAAAAAEEKAKAAAAAANEESELG